MNVRVGKRTYDSSLYTHGMYGLYGLYGMYGMYGLLKWFLILF